MLVYQGKKLTDGSLQENGVQDNAMIVMMATKVAVKKRVEPQNNLDAVQPAIEEEKNEG